MWEAFYQWVSAPQLWWGILGGYTAGAVVVSRITKYRERRTRKWLNDLRLEMIDRYKNERLGKNYDTDIDLWGPGGLYGSGGGPNGMPKE